MIDHPRRSGEGGKKSMLFRFNITLKMFNIPSSPPFIALVSIILQKAINE